MTRHLNRALGCNALQLRRCWPPQATLQPASSPTWLQSPVRRLHHPSASLNVTDLRGPVLLDAEDVAVPAWSCSL